MTWKKDIGFGPEAREKFLAGVNKVGKYVGSTMGPHGRNWIIQQKYKPPQIHNDGVEVARHIFLEDPMEDLAAQTMVDIAMNTNQEVGDGTTTAIVEADALITRGFKEVALSDRISPVDLANEIYEEGEKVIEKLVKQAKKLKKGDLEKVVTTSMRDPKMGKIISDMLDEVGVDGHISVNENWATKRKTETEIVKGMKILGKSVSSYFANTENGKEAVWKDAYVLVTNEKIETSQALTNLFKEMGETKKLKLVIINGFSRGDACYSKEFIEMLVSARMNKGALRQRGIETIDVLPLEAPSMTTENLVDICTYLGTEFVDSAQRPITSVTLGDLVTVKEVAAVNDGFIHITGGRGDTKKRIAELKKQLEMEQDVMFQGKVKQRIASLNASIGQIRVGAPTEAEQRYRLEKITDAINAGKAAMEEGVIRGGGLPLKDIAKGLGKGHILYEALMAPHKTLKDNAGGNLKVSSNVLDPVKVTRLAFENALSAGAQLIATGGGICDRRESLWDKLEQVMAKQFPDNVPDFRDDSNIDLGAPRT